MQALSYLLVVGHLPMGQQKFLPPPQATPQNSLDYENLGKNLSLKKNQQQEENPKLRGKGTIGLPVGISSRRLRPSSSASGIGESLSTEFAISSTARVSMSVAPARSSLEGLGVVEVLPPVSPRPQDHVTTNMSVLKVLNI